MTRRGLGGRRIGGAIALAAVAAVLAAPAARADGDPASDVLVSQDVFFGYSRPSTAPRGALQRAVDGVYARNDRLRLALVYDPTDLGSVGSLFGKPADYAHFLAIELGLWYVGPVLVVMPAGFGVYDGGRSTAAEEDVLRSLRVDGSSPDALADSATAAVTRLVAANALASRDITPPLVTAHPAFAQRGKPATLHFELFDDSGRSSAVVRVYERGQLLASVSSPTRFSIATRPVAVVWRVPARLRSRQLRYCVVGADPSGNRSAAVCAPFLRVR